MALLFETTFLYIYESFEKFSKHNLKMAELSSSNKKKGERSKVAGAATTKTTFRFESEWKKEIKGITRAPNDISRLEM